MIPVILSMVGAAMILLGCVYVASRYREEFEDRFPAISDAEFVARCRPGTDPGVALKVRRIVAQHLAVEYDRIHPTMSFVEDLGAD